MNRSSLEYKPYVQGYEKNWAVGQATRHLPEPKDYKASEIKILVPYDMENRLFGHYEVWFTRAKVAHGQRIEQVWSPASVYWREYPIDDR